LIAAGAALASLGHILDHLVDKIVQRPGVKLRTLTPSDAFQDQDEPEKQDAHRGLSPGDIIRPAVDNLLPTA
jgi:hypothetical protein